MTSRGWNEKLSLRAFHFTPYLSLDSAMVMTYRAFLVGVYLVGGALWSVTLKKCVHGTPCTTLPTINFREKKVKGPHGQLSRVVFRVVLDIGPKTVERFTEIISESGTILLNGPMGVFELEGFHKGTEQIALQIAKVTEKGAKSIIGGGDSASAIKKFGLMNNMSHVSTGGGASLELLSGNTLPALYSLEI